MNWWQDDMPFAVSQDAPWQVLAHLGDIVREAGERLGYPQPIEGVWIASSARVASSAVILPPCVVLEDATVGEWAYLRGNCWIGAGATVGHAVEVKNSVFFEASVAAHYNYVGDSLLGAGAHLGAGAILSNLRLDKRTVKTVWNDTPQDTCLRKLGALVGRGVEIGCNAVLNPGTVVEPYAYILPLTRAKGYIKKGGSSCEGAPLDPPVWRR